MLHQPSGRKGRTPQRHKYTKGITEPSNHHQLPPILRGNHCGPDDRDCHTHTTSQDHCAQDGRDTIDIWLCTRTRHRDGVDMPDAGLHPHREAMDKQHTHTIKAIALSALQRPTCPQNGAIERRQAGMQPQQRKHIGTSPPYGEDTPGRRQVQRRKKEGCMSKGFCANTDPCPLASPRVALVGVACSGTPTKATRGEAKGHP